MAADGDLRIREERPRRLTGHGVGRARALDALEAAVKESTGE